MKILILANNDIGLYQFRKELIEELQKKNSVVIVLPYGELVNPLVDGGCKFINISIDRRGINPKNDLEFYCKFKKILKREKPDLVITYTIKPNIYGGYACRKLKIKYVTNITGLGTAFQKPGILRNIVVNMYKIALKSSKVVFFENIENKELFINEKIVTEDKTCLLMGAGVNLEHYSIEEYPKGEKIKFLFMGRVMKEKGIEELFCAMKRLIDEGESCSLDILGYCEEDYKDEIRKYESEGWLFYHGYKKDVRPYINACHCYVLPSWHEGMANTNLECAAMGRPVITSDIHGCKESVIDGVSGYLCKKKDADSLYKVMKKFTKLSNKEKKNMGEAGREHMKNFFDKRRVVEKTIYKLFE